MHASLSRLGRSRLRPENSDGTQPGKEDSLRAFREFWANPCYGEAENPGCYFTFTREKVQFFMLDCRYYRSPNVAPDGPEKTMKVVAMGSEWESSGSEDSWSVFRNERDAFFHWIDAYRIEGIVFLGGDQHFSSGYHVLGRFLELSAGPFGSNAKTPSALPASTKAGFGARSTSTRATHRPSSRLSFGRLVAVALSGVN